MCKTLTDSPPPQKIAILRCAIRALLTERPIVAQLLVGWKGLTSRPVTANVINVILMEKGVDATPLTPVCGR